MNFNSPDFLGRINSLPNPLFYSIFSDDFGFLRNNSYPLSLPQTTRLSCPQLNFDQMGKTQQPIKATESCYGCIPSPHSFSFPHTSILSSSSMSFKNRGKGASETSTEKSIYTPAPHYLRTVKLRATAMKHSNSQFIAEDSHDDLSIDMHASNGVNLTNALVCSITTFLYSCGSYHPFIAIQRRPVNPGLLAQLPECFAVMTEAAKALDDACQANHQVSSNSEDAPDQHVACKAALAFCHKMKSSSSMHVQI